MTYINSAMIAEDPTFMRRVRQAMCEVAIDIAAEAVETTNHTERRKLSSLVLAAPNGWAEVFSVGVATNPNTGTGISDPEKDDGALKFVISSIWNAYIELD